LQDSGSTTDRRRRLMSVVLTVPPVVLVAIAPALALRGGGIIVEQWAAVAVCTALGVMTLAAVGAVPTIPRRAWVPLTAFAAFVAWSALSLTWSAAPDATVTAVARMALLGLSMLVAATYASRPLGAKVLVGALTATGGVLAVAVEAKILVSTSGAFTESRLSWPIDYANGTAALLWLTVPAIVAVAAASRTHTAVRALLAATAALSIAEGLMALSRGAAIALVGGLVAGVLLTPNRPRFGLTLFAVLAPVALLAGRLTSGEPSITAVDATSRAYAAVIVAMAAGALVGVFAAAERVSPAWDRRLGGRVAMAVWLCVAAAAIAAFGVRYGRPDAWVVDRWHEFSNLHGVQPEDAHRFGNAASNRYDYWRVATKTLAAHPITGVGAGAFSVPWFERRAIGESVTDAHSWEAGALAETGLVGFALLAVSLTAPLIRLARATRRRLRTAPAVALGGSAAYFMINASFDWLLRISAVAIPGFLVLGACAAAGGADRLRLAAAPERWVLATLGALAASVAVPVYMLATLTARAETQAAASPTRALRTLSLAERVNPWAVEPLLVRTSILLADDRPGSAVRAARRATRRSPNDWTAWAFLARAERVAGQRAASDAAARRAHKLNPRGVGGAA
jgi:hypothetical protein